AKELPRAVNVRFSDAATGEAMAGSQRTKSRCPACAIPLYEREIEPGSGIHVDQCPHCAGLFLDPGEFRRVRLHYQHTGRKRRKGEALPPGQDRDALSLGEKILHVLIALPDEVDAPAGTPGFATLALLTAVTVAWLLAFRFGLDEAAAVYGLVPADVCTGRRLYTLITSAFLHVAVAQVLLDALFLWIAGTALERRLGWHWLLGLYLLCGVGASLGCIAYDPGSWLPEVTSTCAITGLLGVCVVLYPFSCLVPRRVRYRWSTGEVGWGFAAWILLLLWVVAQLYVRAYLVAEGLRPPPWPGDVASLFAGAAIAGCVRWLEARSRRRNGSVQSPARSGKGK
ncbi:MAG: rhomboid family intramembrane serine protease, partial [Planctomycetota bacterium]